MAGPPYITDDPEPADYKHGEFYVATQVDRIKGAWLGTAPHLEFNYGVLPDMHLHIIAPFAYVLPAEGTGRYGYGDTELGVKYRFIQETELRPMVGTFPLIEVPTGDSKNGLGSGKTQVFLPLWLQKSIGEWQTYGGGGYWINPGTGNQNFWFFGWQVSRRIVEGVSLGAEVFHTTPKEEQGPSETGINLGLVIDVTENHHVLFSAGRDVQGPNDFHGYLAYQFTFGPAK